VREVAGLDGVVRSRVLRCGVAALIAVIIFVLWNCSGEVVGYSLSECSMSVFRSIEFQE